MRNTTETVEFSVVSRARLSTVWMYALMRAIYATGYVCIPVVRLPYANVFSIHIDIIKFYQLSPMAEGTHTHTLIYSHGRQTQTNAVCFLYYIVVVSNGIRRFTFDGSAGRDTIERKQMAVAKNHFIFLSNVHRTIWNRMVHVHLCTSQAKIQIWRVILRCDWYESVICA